MNEEMISSGINELNAKINKIIDTFSNISKFLRGKEQATYLNHSKIQWTGGIIGAISEYKEDKRLEKLLNAPLYDDLSFYKMTWFIIEETNKMVDNQLEIQKLCTIKDDIYYGNVKRILESTLDIIEAWYNYSPEAAEASLTIGDQKDVGLYATVEYQTKQALKKLDLPPGLVLKEAPTSTDNSGCLGFIIGIALLISALV